MSALRECFSDRPLTAFVARLKVILGMAAILLVAILLSAVFL